MEHHELVFLYREKDVKLNRIAITKQILTMRTNFTFMINIFFIIPLFDSEQVKYLFICKYGCSFCHLIFISMALIIVYYPWLGEVV